MSKPTLSSLGSSPAALGNPGQLADDTPSDRISRNAEGTMYSGRGAFMGTATYGVKAMTADADIFEGVTLLDADADATQNADGGITFAQYDAVDVLREGVVWVKVCEQVTKGHQALAITAEGGAFGSTALAVAGAGRIAINGYFETSAAAGGIAKLHLNCPTGKTTTS